MIFPLVGNDTVKSAVLSAIASKRIPHAIIIEGESGFGKSELAKLITKAVLCGDENAPCENCSSCHLVDVGSHPDMHVVAPEAKKKNIAVDQIREVRLQAYTKPQMSEASVFLIDRAETLNAQSQNTLLKVLEEPPGNAVFIFLCNNLSALLDTVVSRCVIYSLNPVSESVMQAHLQSLGYSAEQAKKAAGISNGNIGTAIKLLNDESEDDTRDIAKEYVKSIFSKDLYKMMALTAEFEKDRVGADRFIYELKYLLCNELRSSLGDSNKTKYVLKLIDITDSLVEPLKTNINLPLLFTNAAFRFFDCK